AFALTYLAAAPGAWRRRLAHVSLAGAVLAVVSLAWVLLVTVTPAQDRPYVDGSTNNNAFSMVFGYDGFDRLRHHVPGAAQPLGNSTEGQSASINQNSYNGQSAYPQSGASNASGGLAQGWAKLFGGTYGTQIGWLYPLALLGLVLGLVRARREPLS